ncbi:MAG: L-aspartate oxidase [Planctomycetota bacterium]
MANALTSRRYLVPFKAGRLPQRQCDVLVVGGGVAGLRAAIAAADAGSDVILLAKDTVVESNTWYAQGGIAAVLSPLDSTDAHLADTIGVGAGLCDEASVRLVVEEGPARVLELLEWGANFDKDAAQGNPYDLAFGLEAGHSAARILHAFGDATGQELSNTLVRTVRERESISVVEKAFALDVLTDTDNNNAAVGCLAIIDSRLTVVWAKRTILATGGAGMLFRETTNPKIATGDGHAMAWRAGAVLKDVELMQFHPTTLYVAGSARALVTEAVRGEGGRLIDRDGHRFMHDYHPDGELAPRDVVSRGIVEQIRKTGHTHVYLDVRHLDADAFRKRFPTIMRLCGDFDLDPTKKPIPVHPSAHYFIGGVASDHDGQTTVPGLYAVGEVACSGLHGANRLASNSLLEGLAFGCRAGIHAAAAASDVGDTFPQKLRHDQPASDRTQLDISDVRSSLRSVMWRNAGIERTGDRLGETREIIDFWGRYVMDKTLGGTGFVNGDAAAIKQGWELQNMLGVCSLVAAAAEARTESRGVHYRLDFPERDDAHWRMHLRWQRPTTTPTPEPVAVGSNASAAGTSS